MLSSGGSSVAAEEHLLQPQHAAALQDVLTFYAKKKNETISEVVAEFNELKEMRLFMDTYSKDDVESMLDGLLALVKTQMKNGMQHSLHSLVLLIKQIFEQAEKHSQTNFRVKLHITEDQALLQKVQEWEAALTSGKSMQLRASACVGLETESQQSLATTIATASDPKLIARLDEYKADKSELEKRLANLQLKATQAESDNESLSAKVRGLEAQCDAMKSTSASSDVTVAQLQGKVVQLEAELTRVRAELSSASSSMKVPDLSTELSEAHRRADSLSELLEDARTEIAARVEKTKQFGNMRLMMQKKNATIKELRDILVSHGLSVPGDVAVSAE